jgi:hypothetical protein
MSINFQGKITTADIRKAVFLNYSPVYLGVNIALMALTAFAIIYLLATGSLAGNYALGLLFVLLVLATPFWQPFQTARAADRPGSLYYEPIRGVIDDTGISTDNAQGKTFLEWGEYTRHKAAREMLLLYKGRYCVNILTPALFASRQDWETCLSLVAEKVPARAARRKA